MKVLGLDISSKNTGWAVISKGKLKNYGAIPIHLYKNTTRIDNHMLFRYANEIKKLMLSIKPTIVAVENVYVGHNDKTAILLSMMSGVARVIGYGVTKKEIPTIYPSQVNKFLKIGKPVRAVRKKLVVKGFNQIFNLSLTNKEDDIADAIGIAYLTYLNLTANGKLKYI